ncbi:MAG: hypothetical protein A3K11_13115 [Nitrospirae bacterium RIFCSPLOWO2_12_FULL_63_8]|nr:MAG: hypothetical protein A3K11_13115 [Nitrospirae bacterium RIFCSPLOWO2_12_FULL_63_8]
MMLLDEPYRWAEAVANRRDYIEDQLRGGSPVVGTGYREGALLVTLVQGQQKVYEVYDRIAMAAIGHPTDIEKVRQAAIDLAHIIGFNYSEADVTLQQLVHFGLGPAVKTAFDEIVRSPYIVRTLLAELHRLEEGATFYSVDYDGTFQKRERCGCLGGIPEADRVMQRRLTDLHAAELPLEEALDAALLAWAAGRWVGQLAEVPTGASELEQAAEAADLKGLLKSELEAFTVEGALLERSRPGKNKYRLLTQGELEAALSAYR